MRKAGGKESITIAMVSDHDDFVLNVARDDAKDIPDRHDLVVNYPSSSVGERIISTQGRHTPLLTREIVRFSPPSWISFKMNWALAHEIGRLGIVGILVPFVRVLFSYDG